MGLIAQGVLEIVLVHLVKILKMVIFILRIRLMVQLE